MTEMVTTWEMAMATRQAGDKEGKGKGSKDNGNGSNKESEGGKGNGNGNKGGGRAMETATKRAMVMTTRVAGKHR